MCAEYSLGFEKEDSFGMINVMTTDFRLIETSLPDNTAFFPFYKVRSILW